MLQCLCVTDICACAVCREVRAASDLDSQLLDLMCGEQEDWYCQSKDPTLQQLCVGMDASSVACDAVDTAGLHLSIANGMMGPRGCNNKCVFDFADAQNVWYGWVSEDKCWKKQSQTQDGCYQNKQLRKQASNWRDQFCDRSTATSEASALSLSYWQPGVPKALLSEDQPPSFCLEKCAMMPPEDCQGTIFTPERKCYAVASPSEVAEIDQSNQCHQREVASPAAGVAAEGQSCDRASSCPPGSSCVQLQLGGRQVCKAKLQPSGTKSCDQLKWPALSTSAESVCAMVSMGGKCPTEFVPFWAAQRECHTMGARLCSEEEVGGFNLLATADCALNSLRVWTSTVCDEHGAKQLTMSAIGGSKASCESLNAPVAHRACCADHNPVAEAQCEDEHPLLCAQASGRKSKMHRNNLLVLQLQDNIRISGLCNQLKFWSASTCF